MKNYFKKNTILAVCLTIFALSPVFAAVQAAEISNFIINKKKDRLFLSFSTDNAFSEDISDLIQSGIPVSFSFDIEIEKKRSFYLPDKTVYEKEIIHKLKYSSLTKTFFIIKPYISEEPYVINSKNRAESEMTSVTDFEIMLPDESKGLYTVYVRARLQEVTLPFYMHKVFFFLSAWDFKTDWVKQDIEL